MEFDPSPLKPHIKEILEKSDSSNISTKAVREALAIKFPGINIPFYKAAINALTQEVFNNMGDSDDESDAGEEEEDDEDIKPRLPSTKITKKKLVIPSPYTSQPTPTSSAPTAGLAGLSRSDDLSMNMNIALGGKTRDEAEFIQATATRLAQIMYEKQMQQQEAEREKSRRAAEKKKKINLGLGRKSKVVHPPGGTGSPHNRAGSDSPPVKRKANQSGMNRLWNVSPAMSAVCGGATQLTRFDCPRLIWVYIKAHGSQHPEDGRIIVPDELLFQVLPEEHCSMFHVGKYVKLHLLTPV